MLARYVGCPGCAGSCATDSTSTTEQRRQHRCCELSLLCDVSLLLKSRADQPLTGSATRTDTYATYALEVSWSERCRATTGSRATGIPAEPRPGDLLCQVGGWDLLTGHRGLLEGLQLR
jgi:hypothetical protein